MVNDYGISNFIHRTINRGGGGMVLDRGIDRDLCGGSDPDRDHGWSTGSRQTGDCSMVTPELEEGLNMDEVLSDLSSVCADGNHQSGYLRFSLKGAP